MTPDGHHATNKPADLAGTPRQKVDSMHRPKSRTTLLATLSVFTLVAVACGGDDDDADPPVPTPWCPRSVRRHRLRGHGVGGHGVRGHGDGGDHRRGAGSRTAVAAGADRELPPGESHVEDEGEPVQGGDLVFGIEADSANPWAPFRTSCATAGYVMLTSVSDPLFTATPEGDIAPMLVESYEPNDDYTEWTFTIRDGITFHDGTPLDGAAVEFNFESCQYSNADRSGLHAGRVRRVVGSGRDHHDRGARTSRCPA